MDAKDTILVYGAAWCGDCRRSKKFLDANQVSYTYVDVEANPDQIEVMQQYNGGLQSIPTIVFPDGRVLVEPSNPLLAENLGLR
jgi:mycoredoxin